MSVERHARAKELFLAACSKPADARVAWLTKACGDDQELRREVTSLLLHHDELSSGSFLEAEVRTRRLPEALSERIDHYRVLRKLGEGGMGEVYEAEQEKPIRRRVALKLIKWGMDTREVVARFDSERQALALMNHPAIAGVFDAGATEGGRPYFAMEYVPGAPITEYCDRHRLSVRERLDLFLQVCDGVQHAHQKGVIHRDIKPSNILVTLLADKPVPKIIDFGVAKATSQRLTERSVYTQLGQWVGTPEYMSPEQAEWTGLDIDTRTDVYSLGVVLYELLVGAQPFDATQLRRAGFEGIRRILREEEPLKPSAKVCSLGEASSDSAKNRSVELHVLEQELHGELDWITMKALEKDRTRRYGSPSDLAEDIRRHQRHEPVIASPPGQAYRLRKFIRRHRVGVAAAVALFLVLTGVALLMTVQAARIARERDRAEQEAAKVVAINEFLQGILESAAPSESLGPGVTVVEALDAASERIDESFRGQPEIEASVRRTIGRTYQALGRKEAALSHLERALEIRRRLHERNHPDLVESLNDLANGVLALDDPDDERAEKLAREAVSLGRSLQGPDRVQLCNSLDTLAFIMTVRGDHQAAKELYAEGLSVAREVPGEASEEFVNLLHNSGLAAEYRGEFAAAESLYRDALERVPRGTYDYAAISLNLAWVAYEQGDYAGAETGFRDCLAAWATLLEDSHPTVALTRAELAMVLVSRGRLDEAEEIYHRVLESDPDLLTVRSQRRAQVASGYGALLTGTGRYAEAERQLLGAFEFGRERLGIEHPRTRHSLELLVHLYEAWGKPREAARYRAFLEKQRPVK